MAWRRTIESEQWTVLDDISLDLDSNQNNTVQIHTTRSIQIFPFNDIVVLIDNKHFLLKGRKEDLINQGGKRTSLAFLNHHLQSYDELTDACYYQDDSQEESRLIAFVVLRTAFSTPNSTKSKNKEQRQKSRQIKDYLKNKIEAVFLPKKIIYISELPRNATGKLPLSQLKNLFLQHKSSENS